MKMLKSMVVMATLLSAQSLLAVAMPKAEQARANSVTAHQMADRSGGDGSCPFGKAAAVRMNDDTAVASTYGTTNLRSPDYKNGADSPSKRR
jgi:hypothetical protein